MQRGAMASRLDLGLNSNSIPRFLLYLTVNDSFDAIGKLVNSLLFAPQLGHTLSSGILALSKHVAHQ